MAMVEDGSEEQNAKATSRLESDRIGKAFVLRETVRQMDKLDLLLFISRNPETWTPFITTLGLRNAGRRVKNLKARESRSSTQ